jgi:hypothetical protein
MNFRKCDQCDSKAVVLYDNCAVALCARCAILRTFPTYHPKAIKLWEDWLENEGKTEKSA